MPVALQTPDGLPLRAEADRVGQTSPAQTRIPSDRNLSNIRAGRAPGTVENESRIGNIPQNLSPEPCFARRGEDTLTSAGKGKGQKAHDSIGEQHRSSPGVPSNPTGIKADKLKIDQRTVPNTSLEAVSSLHLERVQDPSTKVRMDLETFPTKRLIALVASLLQRMAMANDKLKQERGGAMGGTRSLSSTEFGLRASNRQRAPSTRVNPSDMVIPPFRPRTTESSREGQAAALSAASSESREELDGAVTGTSDGKDAPFEATSPQPISAKPDSSPIDAPSDPPLIGSESPAAVLPDLPERSVNWPSTTAASRAIDHPSSLLCFHARNVPSIGIETYLQRILKYCPVTNDVFISLLVYFDRMSKTLANTERHGKAINGPPISQHLSESDHQGFAIDSYNIHRLVIAGITISSKFHSDVFYTNSRYAKVNETYSFFTRQDR
jgi:hypothetical protein